ncbi:hypothetical protein J6590_066558 [Homalodisca vitripennis]|nr:hypothetical protein J6590_066558 [Homalodisca vitripennis]
MSSGGMLDRFRYWRWLGNGSSSDDYEFPTFIGVNVGSVSQLALVRNQFGIMLLPYVVGGNVGSVTVLALVNKHFNFGLSRISYGRRNRIKFGRLLIPYVVGGNVGSVSVLALVRKRFKFG